MGPTYCSHHLLDWEIDDEGDITITDGFGGRVTAGSYVPLTKKDLIEMLDALGHQVSSKSNIIIGDDDD